MQTLTTHLMLSRRRDVGLLNPTLRALHLNKLFTQVAGMDTALMMFRVIEFFAGEAAYAKACMEKGYTTAAYDVKHGRHMDMASAAGMASDAWLQTP